MVGTGEGCLLRLREKGEMHLREGGGRGGGGGGGGGGGSHIPVFLSFLAPISLHRMVSELLGVSFSSFSLSFEKR